MDFDVLTLATPATSGLCSSTDYFHVSNIRSVSIKTWLTSINTTLIWQGTNAAIDTDRQVEIDQHLYHGTSILFTFTFIHKYSVSSKSFPQVETGSAVANEICGENSGSHMYLEVQRKTLEISLKRHLNIIEILWVTQVLGGGKFKEKNIRNIIEKASEYHRNTLGHRSIVGGKL